MAAIRKRPAVPHPTVECSRVEIGGARYVNLREAILDELCALAGIEVPATPESELLPGWDLDRQALAAKLKQRRMTAGLSQAELARRAGVRPETLNRIERGHTNPDFATVRKLVGVLNAVEVA